MHSNVELLDRFSLGPKIFNFFRSNSVALQSISGIDFSIFNLRVSTLLAKCTPEFYITHKMHPRHQTPTMAKVLGNIETPAEFPLIYSPCYLGSIDPVSL